MLNRKSLETLDFRVTDARGRSLATAAPDQAEEGLMKWEAVLRWDLFVPPTLAEPRSLKHIGNHPPEL